MSAFTSELSNISNSFSTGGGGVNFERYVQAFFLFKMVSRDICPILEMPIHQMDFQAKYLGYDTDDLVITALSGRKTAKLLCQIKHDVTISFKNAVFRDVVIAAWSDFKKRDFDRNADKIVLITANTAKKSKLAMEHLRDLAHYAGSVDNFLLSLHSVHIANSVRDTYSAIQACVQSTDDAEVWSFLKSFRLYVMDLDFGTDNSLYDTLRTAIRAQTDNAPELVWSRLCEQCAAWNQRAVSITYDNLPSDIVNLFSANTEESKIEKLLATLTSLDLSSEVAPFAYDYSKLSDIWGRETQLEQLKIFAEDETQRFLFCVITGPAGIGKSKLVFHFGRQCQERNWLVCKAIPDDIPALIQQQNWDTRKNILLIIDYANEQDDLGKMLRTLSKKQDSIGCGKIRVILIAREGTTPSLYNANQFVLPQWYERITKCDRGIHQHLFLNDFINLQGLSLESCISLYNSFTTNHLHIRSTEADQSKVLALINRVVRDDDGLVRPLYALFVMDLYHRNPDAKEWNLPDMQKQIYNRDKERWRSELNNDVLFSALLNLLLYSTIFDGWESDQTLPQPLSNDCHIVFQASRTGTADCKTKWFKMLTGHVVRRGGTPILPRLTPDMVGEFFVLNELNSLDSAIRMQWETLIIVQIDHCKEFFIRALQDFGNEEIYIDIFLKLFDEMVDLLANGSNSAHQVFSSILETFYKNYKGNEKDHIFIRIRNTLKNYIARYHNQYVSAAELELVFHKNRMGIGKEARTRHFSEIEPLYTRWQDSPRIASCYISFLGTIAASNIGAHRTGYQDSYTKKFNDLHKWVNSSDVDILSAFVPVLIEMIQSANGIMDWELSEHLEKNFLRVVLATCSEELLLDFISRFDYLIIDLARQRANALSALKDGQPDYYSTKEAFDLRLAGEISFYKEIIENNTQPSFNFIWTYVTTLPKITKALFIYENLPPDTELDAIEPFLWKMFRYMLFKLNSIYGKYHHSRDNSALARHASRTLDMFCDAKSSSIPYCIKAMCILNAPD